MLISMFLPLAVMLLGAAMLVLHVVSWRRAKRAEIGADERIYRWRQFRRRMQTSGMMVLVGVLLLFAGQLGDAPPWWLVVGLFLSLVVLTVWMLLLAAGDLLSTYGFATRLRNQQQAERLRLEAEFRRAVRSQQNAPSDEQRPT